MKIKSRYIFLASAIIILAIAGYFTWKQFFSTSRSAPSGEQRAKTGVQSAIIPVRVLDSSAIIHDLEFLASDSCEGRKPGSAGHKLAEQRIINRMREAGLDSFGRSYTQVFMGKDNDPKAAGKNIMGWIKGTAYPDKYIVISAHYDHLGIADGKIYYGASDNASGTACLLAMAAYYKKHPHRYSLVFVAFDREETGIEGAEHFVDHLPAPLSLSNIKFNLNIDMIARNENNEIFACGITHYPTFAYAVTEVRDKTRAKLLMGHDKGSMHDDWTHQSDHFAFHKKDIPFIYIGVEDHKDYHAPTDTYDKINYARYIENCNMVVLIASTLRDL